MNNNEDIRIEKTAETNNEVNETQNKSNDLNVQKEEEKKTRNRLINGAGIIAFLFALTIIILIILRTFKAIV